VLSAKKVVDPQTGITMKDKKGSGIEIQNNSELGYDISFQQVKMGGKLKWVKVGYVGAGKTFTRSAVMQNLFKIAAVKGTSLNGGWMVKFPETMHKVIVLPKDLEYKLSFNVY